MNRWMLVLSVLILLCSLFFLNVWQSFRYSYAERQISQTEAEQLELFEENKRLIAGIALLQAPRRLERIASDQLELVGPYAHAPVLIRIARSAGRGEPSTAESDSGQPDGRQGSGDG